LGWPYLEFGLAFPGSRADPTWNSDWPFLELGLDLPGVLSEEEGVVLVGRRQARDG